MPVENTLDTEVTERLKELIEILLIDTSSEKRDRLEQLYGKMSALVAKQT